MGVFTLLSSKFVSTNCNPSLYGVLVLSETMFTIEKYLCVSNDILLGQYTKIKKEGIQSIPSAIIHY